MSYYHSWPLVYKTKTTNTFFIFKKLFLAGSEILGFLANMFNADDKYTRQNRYHMDRYHSKYHCLKNKNF